MSKKVMVETSARHLHLTERDFKTLFGENAALTKKKDVSQPGQYACEERVTVAGPRGEFSMTILGPFRPASQVELSMTDAIKIGIKAPVRESGDINGTPGCKLIGPAGECTLECGVIVAKRHVHLTPETAEQFGVTDNQIVKVSLGTEGRKTIYDDVVIRVNKNFAPAMHIDTDEANAAGISGNAEGEIIS